MKRGIGLLLMALFLLKSICLIGQKYYHEWPAGYGEDTSRVFGLSFLDFNNKKLKMTGPLPTPFNIGSNGAFICDQNGSVMLMTNGCAVFDRNLNVIPGTDMLSPGELYNNYCPSGYYPAFFQTLILPDLTDDNFSIVIHKDGIVTPEVYLYSDHLYSTVIKKHADFQYEVVQKRNILRQERAIYDYVAAIPNQNNQDWLVIEPRGIFTNEWMTYQVNKDTSVLIKTSKIGPELDLDNSDRAQPVFSPDGTKLVFFSENDGLLFYDIDRATGELINFRSYFEEWMAPSDTAFVDGYGFSPNSEFLYITTTRALYQFEENAVQEKFVHIAQNPNLTDDIIGWPSNFGEVKMGPDCRLYISPAFVGSHLHVIHHPNLKGKACSFEMKAITMPSVIYRRVPRSSFYHLATGQEVCDSSIHWFTTSTNYNNNNNNIGSIRLSPNPASNHVVIGFDEPFHGQVRILDINGTLKLSKSFEASIHSAKLRLDLSPGIYFIQCYSKNSQLTYESKLLIHK